MPTKNPKRRPTKGRLTTRTMTEDERRALLAGRSGKTGSDWRELDRRE
jgi:hypothetical protein